MKRLNKTQLARLNSAFAYAQKLTKTAYHFTFNAQTAKQMEEEYDSDKAIMGLGETERGDQDENHFVIDVNVDLLPTRSMKNLRRDAGHEVIHAILDKLYKHNTLKNCENATYTFQRALFGEDNE